MADGMHADDSTDRGAAIPVCPKCMRELLPTVDFCPHCRSPVTSFASIGYIERAVAEGWGIGEAIVTERPSWVTVIGLWLVLAPSIVLLSVVLIRPARDSAGFGTVVEKGFAAITLGLLGWALVHATRRFVRARRRSE